MFTANDLRVLAEAELDDLLEDDDILPNINSALVEFADDYRKTETQTINAVAGEWVDRTSGHLAVVRVAHEELEYMFGFELSYDGSQIRFRDSGLFVVTSIVAPEPVLSMTDFIPVHDVFQVGLSRYLQACFKLKDNDQNDDGMRLKTEAMALIKRASNLLGQGDIRQGQRVMIRR
jgi:hypothetical protein